MKTESTTVKCGCGYTGNEDGTCDGSHANQTK